MKSESHWSRVYKEIAFKASTSFFFYFYLLQPFCLSEQNRFSYLVEGHLGNIPMKFE